MSRNLLENNQFPKPKETCQSIHVSFMWNYSYLKPNVHVSCAIPLLIWMETYHFSSSAFMVLYTIETSFFAHTWRIKTMADKQCQHVTMVTM